MAGYVFCDHEGTFQLERPEETGYLYFPIAGERGLKSAVTPLLGGDAKTDQNHFLMQPVSEQELHNNKNTRNFWCRVEGKGVWSAAGSSAEETVRKMTGQAEESRLTAGFMWHLMERKSKEFGLCSQILNFVPEDENVEIMKVSVTNSGEKDITFTGYGVFPVYGRSADNLRDHRHVTGLLHRIKTKKNSVVVKPVLSFDERGHQENHTVYYVSGVTGEGEPPQSFYPCVNDFIGEGGSFDCPGAVYQELKGVGADASIDGYEAAGAMRFEKRTLKPGETAVYILLAGLDERENCHEESLALFGSEELVDQAFERTKKYWLDKLNVSFRTGNADFDHFMRWVSFQPMLRRIYGCSFLPHHDYGKGGRGWRDLWQDCLALLIMNPKGVKEMLLSNFGGVRIDGSNATIIGAKQGEFIADRNHITRVWMDHGLWPLMTTALYIDQTGDLDFLLRENSYFKDKQIERGTGTDLQFGEREEPVQKDAEGRKYIGSVLEHLLVQNLTGFYEVGEHNHFRLRGADWNDALDMASERGESVAFTAAYAGNLEQLADLTQSLAEKRNLDSIEVAGEMELLFTDDLALYNSIEKKQELLASYCASCRHVISGKKAKLAITEVIRSLRSKAAWIKEHIRKTEWIKDGEDGWFNSYYDNHGRKVEGFIQNRVRMMLTGQVFAIMSGTAEDEQILKIINSADKYLYEKEAGGYRLNTDFGLLKMDLGRMFGFAYGHKENGAVFSHMTTMYANALYKRGFVKEGYKAVYTLFAQASNFEASRIYPGIPEYFDVKGRGMYHYLTGAASWYMMTVVNEMFGVKGRLGALCLEPKLLKNQFDDAGRAEVCLCFGGISWKIIYKNREKKDYGNYKVGDVFLDGKKICLKEGIAVSKEEIAAMDAEKQHEIIAELV